MVLVFLLLGVGNSFLWGLDFLRLGVSYSYVFALVFLRLVASFLTFGISNSYF